jgi:oligosaccharyltransferase complex subunit delta (ribophorin II)
MHLSSGVLCSALLGTLVCTVQGASSWGFNDATVSISGKGTSGGLKEKYDRLRGPDCVIHLPQDVLILIILLRLTAHKPLAKTVTLGPSDSLKIVLTTQEDGKARRPHQAFLSIEDTTSGLETSYLLTVKESGKAKVDLVRLPVTRVSIASVTAG